MTNGPIKLLVDTGASISIVADDLISKSINVIDYSINLYGLVGKEVYVKTRGMVHSIFSINGRLLNSTLHLVDRKFTGPADGYLGYDFLSPFGVNWTKCAYKSI